MNDTDYIFAVARIRVKEKSLLSDADIKQMIGMKDEEAVLDFLMGKGWGDNAESKTTEGILEAEETKTLKVIEELGLDQDILDILSLPKLFHNLKTAIAEAVTSDTHQSAFYDLAAFPGEKALKMVKEKDFKNLPPLLQECAAPAYEIMLKTRDSQLLDQVVDKACLKAMAGAGEKAKSPLLKDYESLLVALTDIKIAVRCQKMKKSLTFITDSLADCSILNSSLLAKAAAGTREDLYKYLETHGFKEASEALKKSSSAFEVWCDNKLMNLIQGQKSNSTSVGPVLAYFLARENEIKTARIVLTAKANDFPDSMIEERVRSMYV